MRAACACPCLLGLFWWSDVEDVLQNHRNITLMEQAKWALFLKSFFEISEAIPWPRDHILFTFSLPTTQATLAKFTKEDPHWKIRLIPDWKFMCWLRWISSGRFSQESGVKGKKRQQNWDPFWLKSGVNVSGRQAKLMSACQELPFMLMAATGSAFSTWRERLCLHLQKWLGLAGCFGRIFQRSTSDTAVRKDATLVYLAVFPIFPLSIYCVLNFASTPSSLMFPVCLSFFSSILPSLPPSLAASTLLPFSSLSSRGGGYG